MMAFLFMFLLVSAGSSTSTCESKLTKNSTQLEVKIEGYETSLSTIGPGAKLIRCEVKGPYWIIEANLGQAGTTSPTTEDHLYIYQIEYKNPAQLLFSKKIREEVHQVDAEGHVNILELIDPVEWSLEKNNQLKLVLKNEKKTIFLPKK